MIKLLNAAEKDFEKMQFKEALKNGFFEMQNLRDKYRDLTTREHRMHPDLVAKFIELQTKLITPFCPHVAEHIWTNILKNDGFVTESTWPDLKLTEEDEINIEAGEYILRALRSFRTRYAAHLTFLSKKKNKEPEDDYPAYGQIYYATTYPPWQATIMNELSSSVVNDALPDNKTLAQKFGKMPELKKYQKKVMPFVQMLKERVGKVGVKKGLEQTVNFDEGAILYHYNYYLENNLPELRAIHVECSENSSCERIKEECVPGEPYMTFYNLEDTNSARRSYVS